MKGKRFTTEEFIKKASKIHNGKYDYSKSEYIGSNKKINIICLIHGVFSQDASEHLRGRGCRKCSIQGCGTERFVEKAKVVHGDRYDYSLVEYKNNTTKVKITCKEHGVFEQIPNNHISQKQGCPICAGNKLMNDFEFIEKAKNVHGNIYDYSMVNYTGNKNKIIIKCNKHGKFKQKPNQHLNGNGCPKCAGVGRTTEDFIKDASYKHDDKYDYSKTIYKRYDTPIKIICPIHGEFEQKPYIHLMGSGCQKCSESKGEKKIALFLEKNKINFERQKIFSNCKNPKTDRHLKFDFYLPNYNICIEYDGEYHYEPWRLYFSKFESEIKFKEMKERDEIKNKYCANNNIKLLRIPYFEIKKIDKIISDYLFKND